MNANYIRGAGEMEALHPQGPGHLSDLRHTMCQHQIESAGSNWRFPAPHTQTHSCISLCQDKVKNPAFIAAMAVILSFVSLYLPGIVQNWDGKLFWLIEKATYNMNLKYILLSFVNVLHTQILVEVIWNQSFSC